MVNAEWQMLNEKRPDSGAFFMNGHHFNKGVIRRIGGIVWLLPESDKDHLL
jgi:hypothetical protein